METLELISTITNSGILTVIAGIFLYQTTKNAKSAEEEKKQTKKMLDEERLNNTAILRELAKSNDNMAKSLELLQQSNERIEFNLNEHRKVSSAFFSECRKL